MDAQNVASQDAYLGVDTEIGSSTYRLLHGESLVGITDSGVDFLVTVARCCHFGAQIGEFLYVFYVFSINKNWVVHSSVLPQNLGFLCIDSETNSVGCFAKTFNYLLGVLEFAG